VLHIHLLGAFQLTLDDRPVTSVNTPRLQLLLAYLVLHRNVPQSRQHLAFTLWPDSDEAQARTNLRNLMHHLRSALPQADAFLRSDTQTLQWVGRKAESFSLDVAEFESLAPQPSIPALERAVALYRGELLPGSYDDWVMQERERLAQVFSGALERLITLLEQRRDYARAIPYAQRLLQRDPLNEAAYRDLMRLYAAQGERASALQTYRACASLLQRELAVEPSPATQAAYQTLLHGTDVSPQTDTSATHPQPLVGRHAEWLTLREAWRAASTGKPHCVLVSGEAGIGKTRLAEELVAWASRQGYTTAVAHCYAAEGVLAYAPVVAWLRSASIQPGLSSLDDVWLTELARLLPELLALKPHLAKPEPMTGAWQRQRLFEALARAVRSARQPMLLLLDNLQWCDRETLEWLHYLLRFDEKCRLLLVCTARSEEMAPDHPIYTLIFALQRDGSMTELDLAPLSASETAELATLVAGHPLDPAQTQHLYDETEGNPLFVVETVRAGDWRFEMGDSATQSPISNRQSLPTTVQAVIARRLMQLSSTAREMAGLAATIGREFSVEVLAKASGKDEDDLVAGLDELLLRRIIRQHGAQAYDFSHDKIREVAYSTLSVARRKLLHRRVAGALAGLATPETSAQVAAHYEAAGLPWQAIPYYRRAADVARLIFANQEAIHYYQHALALLDSSVSAQATDRSSLLLGIYEPLGDLLHLTTRYDDARAAYQQALGSMLDGDPVTPARLHRKLGNTRREQYQYEAALQDYTEARHILGDPPAAEQNLAHKPSWWQAWWLEWIQIGLEIVLVYYWVGRIHEWDELRRQIQPAVERYGTPVQRAGFFSNLSAIEFQRNQGVVTDQAISNARAALQANLEAGSAGNVPAARFGLGMMLLFHDDLAEAHEQMQAALKMAQQASDLTLQARCLNYLAILHRREERVDEAGDCATRCLSAAAAAGMPEYIGTAQANLAWVAWRRGDARAAREHGDAALQAWQQLPPQHASTRFRWTALWPMIAVELATDRLAPAVEYARMLLDPFQQRAPEALAAALREAIGAWDSGNTTAARASLEHAMALARQMRYL
jgi:DNA-binding SARP family transcriptional activator